MSFWVCSVTNLHTKDAEVWKQGETNEKSNWLCLTRAGGQGKDKQEKVSDESKEDSKVKNEDWA